MRAAWMLMLLCAGPACGRLGFNAQVSSDGSSNDGASGDGATTIAKPDASVATTDAGVAPDSPPGSGDYSVVQSTQPYAALAGQPVPGFMVGADDENYPFALPFTFTFYGVAYDSLLVSVNGYVTFGGGVSGSETTLNDCPLDTTPPDAMIAVFWDDLLATSIAPTGSLTYAVSGTQPNRSLAIEWGNMDAFYVAGSGMNSFTQGVRVTQTLVLHESGVIEMHYGPRSPPAAQNANKDCGPDRHRGCSATVGLEAPASTTFKNVQCGTAAGPMPGYVPIDAGRLITFTPI